MEGIPIKKVNFEKIKNHHITISHIDNSEAQEHLIKAFGEKTTIKYEKTYRIDDIGIFNVLYDIQKIEKIPTLLILEEPDANADSIA